MKEPEQLGPYRIVEQINAGGAGVTYLAISIASTRESALLVCLKTPHPMFANDPAYLEAFETEAHFASQLHHPHIVTLQDRGADARGRRYLVYPFVEGLDLGELIAGVRDAGQQLGWMIVAMVAAQVARALEYAHQDHRGSGRLQERPAVIHRDLCPPNILIGVSGVIYLTDFGIACALEKASLQPSLEGKGRIAYSAPERLMPGREYDARADLFSLGVVLFEALTNHAPFFADSVPAYVERVLHGPRPRVETLRAEFQPGFGGSPPEALVQLVEIVHRLLERDPADRYPSAAELVDALAEIAIPGDAHRELATEAERHMPEWRRKIRLHTSEMPAVGPEPSGSWSSTDLRHLESHARRYDAERDGVRVSPADAQRLLDAFSAQAGDGLP
ncbi:serine/threonine protein kinase, partial [bacterium AH-315-N03]|nr:serine/threonine protein kinase [bacterium AH-315-N03]